MQIGIDARELGGHATGVGRYLAHLLRAWAEQPEARHHLFTLYVPAGISVPEGLRAEVRVLPGRGDTAWEQRVLAGAVRRDHPDVLFAPGYSAPLLTRVPVALTIHDVSFLAHPEWFRAREGLRRRVLTRMSARRAAVVLTDSAFSARDIVAHTGIPAGRVRVIPLGTDPVVSAVAARPDRAPVVLFVGSIFTRRHVPDLIAAFGRVAARRPEVRLEIVGEDRSCPPEPLAAAVGASGAGDRVALRAWVPDAELRRLYGAARVFAFLSEYEGFGLTPLEALSAGVPSVVLDTPVAREVYGTTALFVPRGDIEAAARAIETLLDDTPERARILAEAPARLAQYDWARTAAETLRAIEDAGSGRG